MSERTILRIAEAVTGVGVLILALALVPPPVAPPLRVVAFLVLYGLAICCIRDAMFPRSQPSPETPRA